MKKLTDEEIDDIAQEVDAGFVCFVNKITGKYLSIPAESEGEECDEEFWGDINKEIEENGKDYIRIEGMDSHEGYRLMERFIPTVEDQQLALRLSNAINISKPFHNFRYELDYSDEYLTKWYAFKRVQMIEWVKDQLSLDDTDYN